MVSAIVTSSGLGAPKLRPSRAVRDHRVEHGRMVVADDHRAPGADVVDVAVAVDVDQVRAFRALRRRTVRRRPT